MRCDEVRDGLALLVLGALPPAESARLESHIADCGECAAERRLAAEVVEMLPWAVPQAEPPAGVEERLRARTGRPGAHLRLRERVPWRRRMTWVAAAAAALLLLNVGLAGATGLLYSREQVALAELDASHRQAAFDRLAMATLASGSGRTLALHSTAAAGAAYGVFRMDAGSGQIVLVAYGLPLPPTGRVYQGWMHRGSERISVGVFAPQGPDAVVLLTESGQSTTLLLQVDGFGITLEPVGGSPAPTGPAVMVA